MLYDAAVVGLGPNGLRILACLAARNVSVVGFDRGRLGETIYRYPMGVPVVGSAQELQVGEQPPQGCRKEQEVCGRGEYLGYLHSASRRHPNADVRQWEEVIDIQPAAPAADASSAGGFSLTTARLSPPPAGGGNEGEGKKHEEEGSRGSDDAGRSRGSVVHARFVALAIGATNSPLPLRVPGADLPHVVFVEDLRKVEHAKIKGGEVVIAGSGITALMVAVALCKLFKAARVVVCSRQQALREAHGLLGRAWRQEQVVTPWAAKRYGITEELFEQDLDFMEEWRREVLHKEVVQWQQRGILEVRPRCQLLAVNGTSHALLRRQGWGPRALWRPRRSVVELTRADLVVVSHGSATEQQLVKRMGFPAGEVDASTGESTIPGVFTLGFDPPGSGIHHYGDLPGERSETIYDNWLCWGLPAAQATCDAIVKQVRGDTVASRTLPIEPGRSGWLKFAKYFALR